MFLDPISHIHTNDIYIYIKQFHQSVVNTFTYKDEGVLLILNIVFLHTPSSLHCLYVKRQ